MKYLHVINNPKWPLKYLKWQLDREYLAYLCDTIGQDRKPKFGSIVISGGVATSTGWSRTPVIYPDIHRLKSNQKQGFVFGYFDPLKSEIVVFPETIFEVICTKFRLHPNSLKGEYLPLGVKSQILEAFDKEFYPMLIEEIEHGYQENKKQYQSFLSKIVMFTSPLILPYLVISVGYMVFTKSSYWWSLAIFAGLMTWIFLPVWVALIPKPNWWKRLVYKLNARENDAKGKAISIKYYRLARKAIVFNLKDEFHRNY